MFDCDEGVVYKVSSQLHRLNPKPAPKRLVEPASSAGVVAVIAAVRAAAAPPIPVAKPAKENSGKYRRNRKSAGALPQAGAAGPSQWSFTSKADPEDFW